jgi:amidase
VLAGRDTADVATNELPADLVLNFFATLRPDALRGARLGVMRKATTFHPRVEKLLDRATDVLRAAGAEVIDPIAAPDFDPINAAEWEVLCYEFKDGLNAWFTSLGPDAPVKSLAELIAFNSAHANDELRIFGQETLITAQAKGPLTEQAYLDARATARRLTRDEGIDKVMTEHRLDAIVMLTAGPAWLIDPVSGDHFTGETSTLAAVAGYPNVTVPAAFVYGLPVGISFVGRAWSEARLLALAADFEARTKARRMPEFRATVEPER